MRKCVKCDQLDFDSEFYCGVCGCSLQAKARVKKEACPNPNGDLWK